MICRRCLYDEPMYIELQDEPEDYELSEQEYNPGLYVNFQCANKKCKQEYSARYDISVLRVKFEDGSFPISLGEEGIQELKEGLAKK